MAPLLGLIALFCAYWFLVVMPVIVAVIAWHDYRDKRFSVSLVATIVMVVVFFTSASLIWAFGTTAWNLSFLKTVEASVNAEKYGNAIESRAERMVIWLLIYSTVAAGLSGAVTSIVGYSWVRRQRALYQR